MGEVGFVDLAILGLLCGGIAYGYIVSRRLERLRGALLAFGPALDAYCQAVDRSERSVRDLRAESGRIEATAGVAQAPASAPVGDERAVLMATLTGIIRRNRL